MDYCDDTRTLEPLAGPSTAGWDTANDSLWTGNDYAVVKKKKKKEKRSRNASCRVTGGDDEHDQSEAELVAFKGRKKKRFVSFAASESLWYLTPTKLTQGAPGGGERPSCQDGDRGTHACERITPSEEKKKN